jgi:DNA-binding LytR/AlgR family response regulator
MKCIIIEDQAPAQRILKKYIEDVTSLELVGVFSNAIDALGFLNSNSVELIFLDINLPKLSGMEFLKSLVNPPLVILTTAYQDYALESYDYNVVDYLLKPFSFQRFMQAISKVHSRIEIQNRPDCSSGKQDPRDILFIKTGYEHVKIVPRDILYIKSDSDYTELYFQSKKVLSSEPLSYWIKLLDNTLFVRVHKSYIINSSKVEKLMGNQIYLSDKIIIPLGRVYREEFISRFIK